MERRQLPTIKEYLQKQDVQERIQQKTAEARSKATVTISRAGELFEFSENQLRDWERRGLLSAERVAKQDGKSTHRQYTQADLEKLAVIYELLERGYSVGDLEREREVIWQAVANNATGNRIKAERVKTEHLPIDKRIERMDQEEFWRYFVSQALRLSLILIAEEVPDTVAGLILPLYNDLRGGPVLTSKNLQTAGESLIGWLEPNQPFRAFLDPTPQFEFDSDFRIQQLTVMEANIPEEDMPQDSTLIVLQRKAKPLTLTTIVVETIRNLLKPIYEHVNEWKSSFDYGMRDWVYLNTNFTNNAAPVDAVLNGLANMVIELGGKTESGQDRWNFCCILLPEDTSLPLQQRSLSVKAQSKRAPHAIATTTVTPETPGLSLKAFQSGHVIYRSVISSGDPMIAHQDEEKQTRSAIAIPISGEDGLSIAVMYVASNETDAFSERDQRLLRMMSRIVEELLLTYQARQQFKEKLTRVIRRPEIVDLSFKDFLSEGDFIRDVEALLVSIKEKITKWEKTMRREDVSLAEREARYKEERLSDRVVSFIAIDVDNQSNITNKYGDCVTRDLSSDIGVRIYEQLDSVAKNPGDRYLYHAYSGRFYVILRGMPLEEVQTKAEHLREILKGTYRANVSRAPITPPNLPQYSIELSNITSRIAVTWFSFAKLEELLQRHEPAQAVTEVRSLIVHSLDQVLIEGRRKGGNVVISWDPKRWGYTLFSPSENL